MKKILYFLLVSTLLFSCNNNENDDLVKDKKIKKIIFIDEDFENGSYHLDKTLDFNFSYENNLLTKVYNDKGDYLENLFYQGSNLKEIKIRTEDFSLMWHFQPHEMQLYYDGNNKLVRIIDKDNQGIKERIFEYPSNDVIIIKYFAGYDIYNQLILNQKEKITIINQNVQKIEFFNGKELVPIVVQRYEYDNKINPNSKINFNRILALPEMSYSVGVIQNYSQLSKNNVTKVVYNRNYPSNGEVYWKKYILSYTYNQDNLPIYQSCKVTDSSNTYGYRSSVNFQY